VPPARPAPAVGTARVEAAAAPSPPTVRATAAVPRTDPFLPAQPVRATQPGLPVELTADPLTLDDESRSYVEGRPGQGLAEDLAEQRLKELPSSKDVTRAHDQRRRVMPLWQELPLLVVVSFCVAVLVRSFLVQAFVIPSGSMEDTLLIGDRVMVDKIVYETRDPQRGEVVVFLGTDRWASENVGEQPGGLVDRIADTLGDLVGVSRPGEKDFIKRVIGLPGDRVACCENGRVTVNGVPIEEPYLSSNSPDNVPPSAFCGSRQFEEVVVPAGQLFVMGDNRGLSQDSRCQGTVPIDNVVGRAFMRVWPPGRWGGIGVPSYPAVPAAASSPHGPPAPLPPDPESAVIALTALAVPFGRRPGRPGSRTPRTLRSWLTCGP
jgi:signal peptidase I